MAVFQIGFQNGDVFMRHQVTHFLDIDIDTHHPETLVHQPACVAASTAGQVQHTAARRNVMGVCGYPK
jgi:hypothetical protein